MPSAFSVINVSIFIIAFSILIDKSVKKTNWLILILGLMLLICVLLRQFILPFFLLWMIYLVYERKASRSSSVTMGKMLFIFLIPFLLFEAYWINRNYQLKGKFIPFVDSLYAGYDTESAKGESFYYPDSWKAISDFVKSWGGDFIWWNPSAEVTAFISSPAKSEEQRLEMIQSFPDYIYTSKYNQDSLIALQKIYSMPIENEDRLVDKIHEYQESFKSEKPFYYWVYAPLDLLRKFLVHSGTYNLFSDDFAQLNLFEKALKLFYSAFYLLVIFSGFMGGIYLLFKMTKFEHLLLLASAFYIVILTAFIIRRIEYRHFAFSYPFFIVITAFLWNKLVEWKDQLK